LRLHGREDTSIERPYLAGFDNDRVDRKCSEEREKRSDIGVFSSKGGGAPVIVTLTGA